ncbi:MAG: peptide chain release factor 1 [Gammaproteobacteria bacterium]|nr:peptide chain release factor 1 [Gammaproteobacteria bacterium]
MNPALLEKLRGLKDRFKLLEASLADPQVLSDAERRRDVGREHARLQPLASLLDRYERAVAAEAGAAEMLQGDDEDLRELAREEVEQARSEQQGLELSLRRFLLQPDPRDARDVYLEIRAGTGGDEAALFAGDLFRMYTRFAEAHRWSQEILQMSEGEHGGYKEVICRLSGKRVFSYLRFESGAHRVQRVPETESQGRIHTSACTVAVLPEAEETGEIEIDPGDLRVDTYRASGAGGQHVNKTDSAVRLTHLPTGIVVECQDERSQHKNRARALSLLRARLLDAEQRRLERERAEERRSQVGSGDRSERIRTYNYPQGRVTDHRINLSLYKLPQIMEGDLDGIIEPLRQHMEAEQLAALDPA